MIVEITTFGLAASADESAFLAADRQLQTELFSTQPGFLRRTTARRGDEWLVVVLWASDSDASAFDTHIDSGRVSTSRFETLD
jgi:heme-degrading monooxygenase HmoA